MRQVTVIILHPPSEGGSLVALLHEARDRLAQHHAALFEAAGADRVIVDRRPRSATFAERLADLAATVDGGLVLMGAGAVARLRARDADALLAAARGDRLRAMTNNRYSSDVVAIADARVVSDLDDVPSDNALPRRLANLGLVVDELPHRARLAFDLDSPLDLATLVLVPGAPVSLKALVSERGIHVPRLEALRAVAADPTRELLVFGRTNSRSLAWLERRTRCRIRFMAEERGFQTASPDQRPARASLGRLLAVHGPERLSAIVSELADAAILDSRVLLADRFGRTEAAWPSAEDRFASDLLQADRMADPWLRALTVSAADSPAPVLLGGHTLVGPGLRWLLGGRVPSTT